MDPTIESKRLNLRELTPDDAPFILRLLNDPDFLRYIGDKQVRTLQDAIGYLRQGPMASYQKVGFGLYLVLLKGTDESIGICGLLQREEFEYPDLGFAYLPEFRGQGYAFEAAQAVIEHSRLAHDPDRLLAVTSPENMASMALLRKLGFVPAGEVTLNGKDSRLFSAAGLKRLPEQGSDGLHTDDTHRGCR